MFYVFALICFTSDSLEASFDNGGRLCDDVSISSYFCTAGFVLNLLFVCYSEEHKIDIIFTQIQGRSHYSMTQ